MTGEPRRGEEPDDSLVRRSRDGDREAFGVLVRRHQRRVHALAVRILGSADDADDVAQETFVRAWKSLDRFDAARPLGPWLATIAARRALSFLEGRKNRAGTELDDAIPWTGPAPDEYVERAEERARIREALAALSEEQRAVLVLRASEELSYEEIAGVLEIPIGTVMSRLARAREAMRRRMRR